MTLIATVLLTVLAATITIIIVRQTVLISRAEANRTDIGRVQVEQADVQAEFERQLADDPSFFLYRTFAYERPRYCAASEPASIAGKYLVPRRDAQSVPVSQDWPAACTTTWSYPAPGVNLGINDGFTTSEETVTAPVSWSAADYPTRAEVLPPTADDPYLTLRILSAGGQAEVGVQVKYVRTAASTWTLWSSESLDLGEVVTAGSMGRSAFVYSGGRITLPTGQTNLTASVLAGEAGVAGLPLSSGARFLTGDPYQVGIPGFLDIRSTVPRPLTVEELRSSTSATLALACPDLATLPTNSQIGTTYRTSYLCLAPGASVVNTSNAVVAVPADVVAWLVTFNPADTNTSTPESVNVFYSTTPLQYVQDCAVACDLTVATAALDAQGSSAAAPLGTPESPWALLATTYYPSTGIIATDTDVFVSHSSLPSVAEASVTVIAGTPASPADLFVNGSLSTSENALVGLVGTSDVLFPYFATDGTGSVDVTAALAALGYGSEGPATTGVPSQRMPDASSDLVLNITGSLASDGIGDIASTNDFSLVPDPRLRNSAPPMFPSFGNTWKPSSTSSLSSMDVCPDVLSDTLSAQPSCLGSW